MTICGRVTPRPYGEGLWRVGSCRHRESRYSELWRSRKFRNIIYCNQSPYLDCHGSSTKLAMTGGVGLPRFEYETRNDGGGEVTGKGVYFF